VHLLVLIISDAPIFIKETLKYKILEIFLNMFQHQYIVVLKTSRTKLIRHVCMLLCYLTKFRLPVDALRLFSSKLSLKREI
jgi:hypothetical protein